MSSVPASYPCYISHIQLLSTKPQARQHEHNTTTISQGQLQLPPMKSPVPSTKPAKTAGSTFDMYLRSQGRKIEISMGDGNCLFRSFSFQLTGIQNEHISVRTLAVRFQNLNKSVFEPYLTSINQPSMKEHIRHIQTPDVFGTHMEILALATYYGAPVFYCSLQGQAPQQYRWHCFRPLSNRENTFRFPDLSGNPLEDVELPSHFELAYTHNTHYNSIVSLTGELCKDLPELNNEEVYIEEVVNVYSRFSNYNCPRVIA